MQAMLAKGNLQYPMPLTVDQINEAIKHVDSNEVSDGYHTFKELYDHRIELWIALCRVTSYHNQIPPYPDFPLVWRSEYHSDGEKAFGGGWFVLGIGKHLGAQLTYHLPMSYWGQCEFATTLNKAPEWDGHSSADVLERLKQL